jgi:CO dehydrogenase maturation factor
VRAGRAAEQLVLRPVPGPARHYEIWFREVDSVPKLLVSGRGGSGKSTVVALLARTLARSARVLVVDADESNPGLERMLGLAPPGQGLLDYLGGRSAVREQLLASLQRERTERVPFFAAPFRAEDLPAACVSRDGAVGLVRVGKIERAMEGCACPMGAVAREFLKQLTVADGEWVLVDTEAGVEHFGRGVLEGVDFVLLVVDPSHEAVLLAEKAGRLAAEAQKPFAALLNRGDAETGPFLQHALQERGVPVWETLQYSPEVMRANLVGEALDPGAFRGRLEVLAEDLARLVGRAGG